jgi:hypothetical protein
MGSYPVRIIPLELDAKGLMIPHCKSGEEAGTIERAAAPRYLEMGAQLLASGADAGQPGIRIHR